MNSLNSPSKKYITLTITFHMTRQWLSIVLRLWQQFLFYHSLSFKMKKLESDTHTVILHLKYLFGNIIHRIKSECVIREILLCCSQGICFGNSLTKTTHTKVMFLMQGLRRNKNKIIRNIRLELIHNLLKTFNILNNFRNVTSLTSHATNPCIFR